MAMTLEQLRRQLSTIEWDESTYAGIGPAELPLLQELLKDPEPLRAARAIAAISRIADPRALTLLQRATYDPRQEVRVALAASVRRLTPASANALLLPLLDDGDHGVRKFAIKAVSDAHDPAVLTKLREVQARDPVPAIRDQATSRLRQLNITP
jgi:HEAT repeat protein